MKFYVLVLLCCSNFIFAQQEHAWVYFKDKPKSKQYLANPLTMLSKKALDRRQKQHILVDITDVPIETTYLTQLKNIEDVAVLGKSKWLNAVHILATNDKLTELRRLSFVEKVQSAVRNTPVVMMNSVKKSKLFKFEQTNKLQLFEYGKANNQTTMLGLDLLHKKGYSGSGFVISVIDGGFYGVNSAAAFRHLLDGNTGNGEVLGSYNFVNPTKTVYAGSTSTHGTNVLSTIAALKPNEFLGAAPKANFYLFVTEDGAKETPLEETLWVQAAERSDSLGVDIINTSLGYTEFDEPKYSYSYADMDGTTTFISRGASIAATKGILLVTSVGNLGNKSWRYMGAPADANNCVAVGSVDANETISFFSSFGPTSDNRIKPETLAQGESVYVVNENSEIEKSNGTSFSSPIIAAAAACLWQAFPEKTSLEIRELIISNSSSFTSPTTQNGYGLLNLKKIEGSIKPLEINAPIDVQYQKNNIIFVFNDDFIEQVYIQIYSSIGVQISTKKMNRLQNKIDINHFANGIYFMRYQYQNQTKISAFVK